MQGDGLKTWNYINPRRGLSSWCKCIQLISLVDPILWNFDLKNMISTYIKNFHGKYDPNLPDFKKKKKKKKQGVSKLPDFYNKFQHVAKNIKGFFFFLLSYLIHSQIWLNCLMDDHHFSYFTKLKKTNPWFEPIWHSPINMSIMIKCMLTPSAMVAMVQMFH